LLPWRGIGAKKPSSISRVIAGLESTLGFRLFQRTTRRMSLTEAGSVYLARVKILLEDFEQARDEALALSGLPTGRLRLYVLSRIWHNPDRAIAAAIESNVSKA